MSASARCCHQKLVVCSLRFAVHKMVVVGMANWRHAGLIIDS